MCLTAAEEAVGDDESVEYLASQQGLHTDVGLIATTIDSDAHSAGYDPQFVYCYRTAVAMARKASH